MSRRYQFDVRVQIRIQIWQKYLFRRGFTLIYPEKWLNTAVSQGFLFAGGEVFPLRADTKALHMLSPACFLWSVTWP